MKMELTKKIENLNLLDIWKPPFCNWIFENNGTREWSEVYIRDSENHIVFNIASSDVNFKQNIVKAINDEVVDRGFAEMISEIEITHDDKNIFFNSEKIMLIRGWGYLNGCNALNLDCETACGLQVEMLEYATEKLKNVKTAD